jgi:N-acetylmuramoyl-L-alanine amidase
MTIIDHKFWLAVNLYHEARGEPLDGQIAIGHVVINRALKKGVTVKDVILKPWQFSWHNGNKFPPIEDYESLSKCLNAAESIINERLSGKDLWRADHYFNPTKVLPSWAKKMKLIKRIGNHDFYRE